MTTRVCIIGAGVSGLRCATVLLENGFDVTILEARNRIGGRVAQSDEMGPLPVDIGANWVHSTDGNPIVNFARSTNTSLHLWKENTLIVDTQGELVESTRANNALKTVWKILEKAIEYSNSLSEQIDASLSLYDFFAEQCKSLAEEGLISQGDIDLVLRMSEMWGAYVGTRVEMQSLKYFFLEDCIDEDDYFIPSNYMDILNAIAARPLKDADVRLNTAVLSIDALSGDGQSPGKIQVTTSSVDDQAFDYVIVTTPLGWLKDHKKAIRPLSDRVSQAIDSISVGNLEKVSQVATHDLRIA